MDEPAPPTPLHRHVGRALLAGLVAGVVVVPVVGLYLAAARALDLSPSGSCGAVWRGWPFAREEAKVAGAVGAGSVLGLALILLAGGLALRVRTLWRPVALLGTGAITGLLIALATACVEVGPDPEALAWRSSVVRWWRENPDQGAADLVVVAVVALAVGLPRTLPWRGAPPPWPRRGRVAAAIAGGLVAWLAAVVLAAHGPGVLLEPWPFWDMPGAFPAAALGVALGLEAGEAADDALVRRWRARLDREARLGS